MNKRITINTEKSIYLVNPEDILYCKCNAASTTLCLKNDESLVVTKKMDAVEKLLKGKGFIRPHHDFLVNKNFILRVDMIDGYTLVLTNQTKIPIADKDRVEILESIKHQ
jgi:two-component system LytT family response regulator